jgi:hypothetical protein
MTRPSVLTLLTTVSLLGVATVKAEVSCSSTPAQYVTQMSSGLGNSPLVWRLVGLPTDRLPLNEQGEARGDIEPAIALNGPLGRGQAVWQYWDGQDFEIAFSECLTPAWTPPSLLTENTSDDIQPTISIAANGAVGVTWIHQGSTTQVKYREFEPALGWSPIVDVSAGPSQLSRPSIAFHEGSPRVAFIEPSAAAGPKLVVASSSGSEPWPFAFEPEIIAQLNVGLDPEPELFAGSDRLVATWIDSATHVGFARRANDVWSAPQYEPYAGAADLGRARVRAKVRALRAP